MYTVIVLIDNFRIIPIKIFDMVKRKILTKFRSLPNTDLVEQIDEIVYSPTWFE